MEQQNPNETLMNAIESRDIKTILLCLENGADVNYTRHKDEDEPNGSMQPTTPLRLVMFCISDCLLEDDHLKQFAEIANLLLQHGADPKPAMQLAEYRYGKYDPAAEKSPFMDVWHLVASGKSR
ncbi:MAG: hypothetical protein ACHQF2_02470 [Flavobacteriales bacterium]